MRVFVTGAAGFIGSNLVDRLLSEGYDVVGYDNFVTGQRRFVERALSSRNFRLVEGDLLDSQSLGAAMRDSEFVFHLGANADVRFGIHHPFKDIQQNIIATFNVLEAMRAHKIQKIAFSS